MILLNFYRCEATPDKPQAFGCEPIDVEPDSQNLKFCTYHGNGERDPHQDCQPEKNAKVSFERLWANLGAKLQSTLSQPVSAQFSPTCFLVRRAECTFRTRGILLGAAHKIFNVGCKDFLCVSYINRNPQGRFGIQF